MTMVPAAFLRRFLALHPGLSTETIAFILGQQRQTIRVILRNAAPAIVPMARPIVHTYRLGRPPQRWIVSPFWMTRYRPSWDRRPRSRPSPMVVPVEMTEWIAALHAIALWCPTIVGCELVTLPTLMRPTMQVGHAIITGAGWIDYDDRSDIAFTHLKTSLMKRPMTQSRVVFVGGWIPPTIASDVFDRQILRIQAALHTLEPALPSMVTNRQTVHIVLASTSDTIPDLHHLIPRFWRSLDSIRSRLQGQMMISTAAWKMPLSFPWLCSPVVTTWTSPTDPPHQQSIATLVTRMAVDPATLEQWRDVWYIQTFRSPQP